MRRFIQMTVLIMLATSCGSNPFKSQEKKEPAEDATIALENNNAQKAIDLLEAGLLKDPGNITYTSILSLAYAQRAGVDPLTLAQKMAATGTSSSTSGNGLTVLFGVMPAATDANIADVDKAVTLIVSIPAAQRITADTLKLAMFETAALTLRLKALDTNNDGVLSVSELLSMSSTSAIAIITQLATATGVLSGSTDTSTTSKAAAAQITAIQTAINASSGTTSQEKLANYLKSTAASN